MFNFKIDELQMAHLNAINAAINALPKQWEERFKGPAREAKFTAPKTPKAVNFQVSSHNYSAEFLSGKCELFDSSAADQTYARVDMIYNGPYDLALYQFDCFRGQNGWTATIKKEKILIQLTPVIGGETATPRWDSGKIEPKEVGSILEKLNSYQTS